MPCGGDCRDEPLDIDEIRKKYPNEQKTPFPVITVEPAKVKDVIEASGKDPRLCDVVMNKDGEEVGFFYNGPESPATVEPYKMPESQVRYTTPAPFRYPSDREDLGEFALRFFGECMQISREKNLRYAGQLDPFKNFRLGGTYGIAIRMTDKVSRLLTLTEPGCKIDGADESVEDTCRDLANYAMLLSAMRANERS